MDLDYTGSRLLSGSRDNTLRIFDFNGMKSTMKSFRKLEPSEGHPMLAASWSPTGIFRNFVSLPFYHCHLINISCLHNMIIHDLSSLRLLIVSWKL